MAAIRRIESDDWELLRKTRLEALADAPYAFGSTYEREVAFGERDWRARIESSVWFVAMEDDRGVGLVAGGSFSPPPARDVLAMWTHADWRGTSVATELVQAVIDWARDDGATELLLAVADGNDRAQRFYEKLGFVGTGNRKPLQSNPAVEEEELRLQL